MSSEAASVFDDSETNGLASGNPEDARAACKACQRKGIGYQSTYWWPERPAGSEEPDPNAGCGKRRADFG